jgi:thymidylate synthase
MSNIKSTLKQRGSRYGSFEDNARITQGLCDLIKTAPNYDQLKPEHVEAYHMIFHKIARSVCGDPMYTDNVHDIVGYATLLEKFLDKVNGNEKSVDITFMNVNDIRNIFLSLKEKGKIADNGTYEILNASFIADEESIFGKLNMEYIKSEITWYFSKSRYIEDIPGKIPSIWKQIASKFGKINSNYGWCIFSDKNQHQYRNALKTLLEDKTSRQATMIYIRPTMHKDAKQDGMNDFMCTYAVQLIIRENKLHYMVFMRSNDAIFGYKNDRYWHNMVFDMTLNELNKTYPELTKGNLHWNVASLHIYPRHFDLIV